METALESNQGSGGERVQLQSGIVQHSLGLGIRGQENLEAAIQQKTIDHVGARPAPDGIGCLNHATRDAQLARFAGASKTR